MCFITFPLKYWCHCSFIKVRVVCFPLQQVTRLVELLTKPKPLFIDGVRVYAEVAKPLKNPK